MSRYTRHQASYKSSSHSNFGLDTQAERANSLQQVRNRLDMLKVLLDKGWDQRTQILTRIASQLHFWKTRVIREKVQN